MLAIHHDQGILQRQEGYQRVDKMDHPQFPHQKVAAGIALFPAEMDGRQDDLVGRVRRHGDCGNKSHGDGRSLSNHQGKRQHQGQVQRYHHGRAEEKGPVAGKLLFRLRQSLVFLFRQQNAAPNQHKKKIEYTDAGMPYG